MVNVSRSSHTNVNFLNCFLSQCFHHLFRELGSHNLSTTMNRYTIHTAIRSRKVDELKDVWGIGPLFDDLVELGNTALRYEYGLSWQNISNIAKAKLSQSNGFRG